MREELRYTGQISRVVISKRNGKWFASISKTCNGCGYKKKDVALSDRQYHCPECGLEIDRDLNAAINLCPVS